MNKEQADRLDITKQPGKPAKLVTPMEISEKINPEKICYTIYQIADDPEHVLYEGIYFLPLRYTQKLPKMMIPEAKKKQKEEFANKAHMQLKKRVKRIIKKIR